MDDAELSNQTQSPNRYIAESYLKMFPHTGTAILLISALLITVPPAQPVALGSGSENLPIIPVHPGLADSNFIENLKMLQTRIRLLKRSDKLSRRRGYIRIMKRLLKDYTD